MAYWAEGRHVTMLDDVCRIERERRRMEMARRFDFVRCRRIGRRWVGLGREGRSLGCWRWDGRPWLSVVSYVLSAILEEEKWRGGERTAVS